MQAGAIQAGFLREQADFGGDRVRLQAIAHWRAKNQIEIVAVGLGQAEGTPRRESESGHDAAAQAS
jgi:hypothetical protein